MEKASVRRRRS